MSTSVQHAPHAGTVAGCEQGFHAWQHGRCIYCGHLKPGSEVQRRERRRERFRREYRRMMRDASMLYRRHLKRGTLEDRQTAASFLCTAVMWRKLSQGVPPEVHR